jgi:hypothetical protein
MKLNYTNNCKWKIKLYNHQMYDDYENELMKYASLKKKLITQMFFYEKGSMIFFH